MVNRMLEEYRKCKGKNKNIYLRAVIRAFNTIDKVDPSEDGFDTSIKREDKYSLFEGTLTDKNKFDGYTDVMGLDCNFSLTPRSFLEWIEQYYGKIDHEFYKMVVKFRLALT